MNRRKWLLFLTGGIGGVSGCQSTEFWNSSSSTTTPSETTPTETSGLRPITSQTGNCRDGRRHYDRKWAILQDYDEFRLTVEPSTVKYGEKVTFKLRNQTTEQLLTGNKQKFALQRESKNGWEELLYYSEDSGFTAEGKTHEPGEGFTWEFEATKEGFSRPPFRVCDSLIEGTYRFLYWGITHRTTEEESAVMVEFDIVRE